MASFRQEFLDLAKASGWSQAEIARRLRVQPGTVSGIVAVGKEPSEQLVMLFRLTLLTEKPEVLASRLESGELMGEVHAGSDSEIWKARATLAERELHELKQALRELLARPSPKMPEPKPHPEMVNSDDPEDLKGAVEAAAEERKGKGVDRHRRS